MATRKNAGKFSKRKSKGRFKKSVGWTDGPLPRSLTPKTWRGEGMKRRAGHTGGRKKNPVATTTTIRGWVKAKGVKIVRNKAGKAVSVKIRT